MKTHIKCPICGEFHDHLVYQFHSEIDQPMLARLHEEAPTWQPSLGACTRCLDQAQLELQLAQLQGTGKPDEVNGYKILPTPVRLMAEDCLTGKGVTICMIDSGFFPHPDLVQPENRILAHLDVTEGFTPAPTADCQLLTANWQWHGTMTSVVAAGNGFLSGGMYRGIASGANLVLLKVMEEGVGITGGNIVKAIDWAIENRKRYNIRIINLSVYDDRNASFTDSELDKAVERALAKGIVVVAAAGNDPSAPILPPANSPHAITVGGLNDRNTLDPLLNTLYHSAFGETIDRFQKPDLVAPSIWLAAPMLPGTPQQVEAAVLYELLSTDDDLLRLKLDTLLPKTELDGQLVFENTQAIRRAVGERIGEAKYISPHYQHADGTSFAAPIVCSVIAQVLEVNPRLDPATIREILCMTARQLPGESAERQGWGVIQPSHAVQMAAGQPLSALPGIQPVVDYKRMVVEFYLNQTEAESVVLTGDFTGWRTDGLPLKNGEVKGLWKGEFPFSGSGVYRYKFLIDRELWLADPRNFYRESDGFGGFNSKLIIV